MTENRNELIDRLSELLEPEKAESSSNRSSLADVFGKIKDILSKPLPGTAREDESTTEYTETNSQGRYDRTTRPHPKAKRPREIEENSYEDRDIEDWDEEDDDDREDKHAAREAWHALRDAHHEEWDDLKDRHRAERDSLKDEHRRERDELRQRVGRARHRRNKRREWRREHRNRGRGRGRSDS